MPSVIGFLSILFILLSFASKSAHPSRNSSKLYALVSVSFFGISLYFYGGINGFSVILMALFVNIACISYDEEKFAYFLNNTIPIFGIIFYTFFSPEGIAGIAPALSLVGLAASKYFYDAVRKREIYLLSLSLWLIYSIALNSFFAMVYILILMGVLIYELEKFNKIRRLYDEA